MDTGVCRTIRCTSPALSLTAQGGSCLASSSRLAIPGVRTLPSILPDVEHVSVRGNPYVAWENCSRKRATRRMRPTSCRA